MITIRTEKESITLKLTEEESREKFWELVSILKGQKSLGGVKPSRRPPPGKIPCIKPTAQSPYRKAERQQDTQDFYTFNARNAAKFLLSVPKNR